MRIFKYTLAVEHSQVVNLPKDAQILCVQAQHGLPQLWALVDDRPGVIEVAREFITLTTGGLVGTAEIGRHLGTYQLDNGAFVGHVFEAAP